MNNESDGNSSLPGEPLNGAKAVRPAKGCSPPTPEELELRWAVWYRAMEVSHEMLLSGLRERIGPDGDLQAAYRDWYDKYQALKWNRPHAT